MIKLFVFLFSTAKRFFKGPIAHITTNKYVATIPDTSINTKASSSSSLILSLRLVFLNLVFLGYGCPGVLPSFRRSAQWSACLWKPVSSDFCYPVHIHSSDMVISGPTLPISCPLSRTRFLCQCSFFGSLMVYRAIFLSIFISVVRSSYKGDIVCKGRKKIKRFKLGHYFFSVLYVYTCFCFLSVYYSV